MGSSHDNEWLFIPRPAMVRTLWRGRHEETGRGKFWLFFVIAAIVVARPIERLISWCRGRPSVFTPLETFEERLMRNPRDGKALFGRGRLKWLSGEYEEALDDLDEAVACGHRSAELYRCRARCHENVSLYEEAVADYSRYLQLRPTDARVFYWRGFAQNQLGYWEEALADFNRAEQMGTKHAALYLCRAQAWRNMDRMDKALEDVRRSRALPNSKLPWPLWHAERAELFLQFDLVKEAIEDYTQALAVQPKNTSWYEARAAAYQRAGKLAEAEADYETVEQILWDENNMADKIQVTPIVQEHFSFAPLEEMNVTIRKWPGRVAADLQRAMDQLDEAGLKVKHFYATQQCSSPVTQFTEAYVRDRHNPVIAVPPQYFEIDIGEAEPVRALRDGLWLLDVDGVPVLVLLHPEYGDVIVQVAARKGDEGLKTTHRFFQHIEDSIRRSESYRGKILSLENREMFNGQGLGIMVHKLKQVERESVILPSKALELLDRNAMQFIAQRPRFAALGLSLKKGLLLYGPPGTGKTHTIHYLAGSLPKHTTFLISAEQVGHLGEYMTLARLLQPSLVVIEDVDLIARDRADMRSAHEEVLLNKLLNEMDGLRSDAEILFVLTTNRASALEEALASRPGRIDQAIEFPLPDAQGRAKLVRLYAQGVTLGDEVVEHAVKHTENVSAAFIKELMRRSIQFALLAGGDGDLTLKAGDVDKAIEEMLVQGGSLNRKLLGAAVREA